MPAVIHALTGCFLLASLFRLNRRSAMITAEYMLDDCVLAL